MIQIPSNLKQTRVYQINSVREIANPNNKTFSQFETGVSDSLITRQFLPISLVSICFWLAASTIATGGVLVTGFVLCISAFITRELIRKNVVTALICIAYLAVLQPAIRRYGFGYHTCSYRICCFCGPLYLY